jgi:hypothetical protein
MVQAFGRFCAMIPIFGRVVTRYHFFDLLAGEMTCLFFVWFFGMEYMLSNTSKDSFMAHAMPRKLVKRFVTPLLLLLHEKISELVTHELWDKFVVAHARNVLGGLVYVKILSEKYRVWLLHVLEEARAVVVPAITLFMPGFITSFGVAYVQYIVPCAKSVQAKGDANKLVYLQYWVLNCALTGLLNWFSSILWWIPFSNHLIFILWSYFALPHTIRSYYNVLEFELIAFGLLKGRRDSVDVNQTKTAKLLRALVNRLPSAAKNVDTIQGYGLESKSSEDTLPGLGSKTSDSEFEETDTSISPRQRPSTRNTSSFIHTKTE